MEVVAKKILCLKVDSAHIENSSTQNYQDIAVEIVCFFFLSNIEYKYQIQIQTQVSKTNTNANTNIRTLLENLANLDSTSSPFFSASSSTAALFFQFSLAWSPDLCLSGGILSTIYPQVKFTCHKYFSPRFIANMGNAIVTAFGTASSSATLPVTINALEEKNKVDSRISRLL